MLAPMFALLAIAAVGYFLGDDDDERADGKVARGDRRDRRGKPPAKRDGAGRPRKRVRKENRELASLDQANGNDLRGGAGNDLRRERDPAPPASGGVGDGTSPQEDAPAHKDGQVPQAQEREAGKVEQ